MIIEELENLVKEFLSKMNGRIEGQHQATLDSNLQQQYKQIIRAFENIHPLLGKFENDLQFGSLGSEKTKSTENVKQQIYDRVRQIKRALENGVDIKKVKAAQERPRLGQNARRMENIDGTLREVFKYVLRKIQNKGIFFRDDLETLDMEFRRIVRRGTENIESEVFRRTEITSIEQETNRFLAEVEAEIMRKGPIIEKAERAETADRKTRMDELAEMFIDGPVCPVVKDKEAFAKRSTRVIEENKKSSIREDIYKEII